MAARTRTAALLLLSVAAACRDSVPSTAPPLDQFYYPTGLAVRHSCTGSPCQVLPDGETCIPGTSGCQSQLLVASSNFDLRYDALNGGTLLSVDVDAALGGQPTAGAGDANADAGASPFVPGAVLGAIQMGSFAGEVAYVDEASCPGWTSTPPGNGPQVLVTSRAENALFRLDVDPTGALSCGPNCEVPLLPTLADGYGVTVVCGNLAGPAGGDTKPRHLAFVTYLRAPNSEGFISRIDLDIKDPSSQIVTTYDVGSEPTQSTVFDKSRGLLFTSELFATVGVARLRWLDLAFPQLGASAVDYGPVVRGAELVALGLSSDTPPSRIYVGVRLYDVDTATSSGVRPVGDVGGALLVLDLAQVLSGAPAADTILQMVRLDRGPTALAVVPKLDASWNPQVDALGTPQDLVALTSSDDGTMTLYDSETEQTVAVFTACASGGPIDEPLAQGPQGAVGLAPAPCPPGKPSLGQQPFAIAYEPYQLEGRPPLARLFIDSFDRSWVNAIVIDPANPAEPISWGRIGPERQ